MSFVSVNFIIGQLNAVFNRAIQNESEYYGFIDDSLSNRLKQFIIDISIKDDCFISNNKKF
jgi:hypothetical protein